MLAPLSIGREKRIGIANFMSRFALPRSWHADEGSGVKLFSSEVAIDLCIKSRNVEKIEQEKRAEKERKEKVKETIEA